MNTKIDSLFAGLKAANPETQNESALALGFLLERTLWPGRHDAEHQMILSKDLASLKLDSGAEVDSFIERMRGELDSPDVPINAKLGLSTALAKTSREACLNSILRLLDGEVETLTDEESYGLIAAVLPRSSPSLLKKYERAFNRLLARNSERLKQPLTLAMQVIRKNFP